MSGWSLLSGERRWVGVCELPEFGSWAVAALAGAKKDNFLSSLKLVVHKVIVLYSSAVIPYLP